MTHEEEIDDQWMRITEEHDQKHAVEIAEKDAEIALLKGKLSRAVGLLGEYMGKEKRLRVALRRTT